MRQKVGHNPQFTVIFFWVNGAVISLDWAKAFSIGALLLRHPMDHAKIKINERDISLLLARKNYIQLFTEIPHDHEQTSSHSSPLSNCRSFEQFIWIGSS
jgi:hypothetical protein